MKSRSSRPLRAPRATGPRAVKVMLIRAVHERLTSGQFLHLPVHTRGVVEKDMGDTLRVRFTPAGEPLHPPNSPLSPRLAGDRVLSITAVVSRVIVREV